MSAGVEQFNAQVQAWFGAVRTAAQEAAVGLAEIALVEILKESPQFSGDFVSGWNVSFDTHSTLWRPAHLINRKMISAGVVAPYEKGDEPSIEYAIATAAPRFASAKKRPIGTSVFLSNNAYHDEEYAWKIEKGEIDFRPENPNAAHVVERALDHLKHRYSTIGKSQFAILRSTGV